MATAAAVLERLGVVRTEVSSADFAPRKEEDPWVAVRGLLREGTAMRCPPPPDDGELFFRWLANGDLRPSFGLVTTR